MLDLFAFMAAIFIAAVVVLVIPWLIYRRFSRARVQHKTLTEHDARLALYGGRHERVDNRATSNHNGVLIHGRD